MLHGLQRGHAPGNFSPAQPQAPGNGSGEQDIPDVMLAQQPGIAGDGFPVPQMQKKMTAFLGNTHIRSPCVAAFRARQQLFLAAGLAIQPGHNIAVIQKRRQSVRRQRLD